MSKKSRFGEKYGVYLEELKNYVDPVKAAEKAGLDYEEIYKRRQDDVLFAEAEIIAEEIGSFVNERNMKELASGGDMRAVQFMAKERKALEWRNRPVDELSVKDGDRIASIVNLVDQLNQREELYGQEIEID